MKKTLILTGILSLLMASTSASLATQDTTNTNLPKRPCPCAKPMPPEGDRANISERLNLTEEQKQQAHELRMQGHEKMKPIFDKIQYTKQEIRKIQDSNLTQAEKDTKVAPLKEELKQLFQDAKKIRIENTKQFEAILTDKQKAEFEKIKQEGRERAEKHRNESRKNPAFND